MKYIALYTGIVVLMFPFFLNGQDWGSTTYGFFGIQYQQSQFDGLNRQLEDLGYAALSNEVIEIQGGAAKHKGRWRISAAFNLMMPQERSSNNGPETRYEQLSVNYSTSYGLLRPASNWYIAPEINLHGQYSQITLSSQAEATSIRNASEIDYLKINRISVPMEVGILVQNAMRSTEFTDKALIVGIRLGYRLDDADAWKIDQAVRLSGSGIRTGGWFGSLHLGFQ